MSFDPEDVTRLAIEEKGRRIALSRTAERGWRMTAPEEGPASAAAVDAALRALSSLSASGFEDDLSASECGFGDPTAVVSVDLAFGEVPTLTIGADSEAGYFVRRNDRGTIYRVPVSRLERVLVGPEGFASADG
jgi:hypothetical protein